MVFRHTGPLLMLLALGLGVRLLTAWPLHQPGYTDAYYYAVGARQLYEGQGFKEPFIWSWLDPPNSVLHPGYLYWMPLTAILGWLGMAVGGNSFRAMQAPFVLLSAFLPLVAYGIAWDLTGKRRHALLAGLLAVFPGYYAHVLVLPDNFSPFALFGSLCLWAAGRGLRSGRPGWLGLAGLAAGLGHLARADGVLLLGVGLLASLFPWTGARSEDTPARRGRERAVRVLLGAGLVVAGYLAVMGPWFVRNWRISGAILSSAGTRTAFLTDYDEIFNYGSLPTLDSFLAWGWPAILASKWQALLINLQRLWVEGLLVVLLPFSGIGLWKLRRQRLIWPFLVYLPLLFLVMTLVFTFPGTRGGLYHSGAALLPFFFATSGPGLEAVLQAAARRFRGWQVQPAWTVFSGGLVVIAALLTTFALWRAGVLSSAWNERDQGYAAIGQWLDSQREQQAVVMVGDAPAFTWHTRHPAIAVPNDPLDTVVTVAERYGARYLVLDDKRPRTTDSLYAGAETHARLVQSFETGSWRVYEFVESGPRSSSEP